MDFDFQEIGKEKCFKNQHDFPIICKDIGPNSDEVLKQDVQLSISIFEVLTRTEQLNYLFKPRIGKNFNSKS